MIGANSNSPVWVTVHGISVKNVGLLWAQVQWQVDTPPAMKENEQQPWYNIQS